MAKWVMLALGVFLFVNGSFTRTYGYSDPEKHCFQMDLIDFVGCFGSPTIPELVPWVAMITGGLLILACLLLARAQKAQKRPRRG